MKTLMIILMAIGMMSCNTVSNSEKRGIIEEPTIDGFGRLSEEPNNWWNGVYGINYHKDYIQIGSNENIQNSQLSKLIEIFGVADKLSEFCFEKSTTDISNKELGYFNNNKFIFNYSYNDIQYLKQVQIEMVGEDGRYNVISCFYDEYNEEGNFVSYLTDKRNLYIKRLNDYENNFKKTNENIDSYLNTIK